VRILEDVSGKEVFLVAGLQPPADNIIETLPAGETKTISFIADQVGEFNFFCSVFCGSGHSDMRGKLIVNP